MPREASKRKNWEKDRRDRFNKTIVELAQILPSYNPSVTINRIEVLREAITTISELKCEVNKLSESPEEVNTYKDELVKKLQDRIKKLIIRNDQLVKLYQNAGIKLPRTKRKVEKENQPSKNSSTKISKSPKNQGNKLLKPNNGTRKPPQPKKFTKKILATNNLILFPRLSTVPIYNQQFVLVPSPSVVNNSRIATVVTAAQKKPKSRKIPAPIKLPNISPPSSSLPPGTLILANGNIISVVSQPQMLVHPVQTITSKPPINPASQSLNIPPRINLSLNRQTAINLGVKIKPLIKPKDCVTRTTQINKVPIPAFTSRYGSSSLLLKNQTNKGNENTKKTGSNKNSTSKRKNEDKIDENVKKRKTCNENDKKTSNLNTGSTGFEEKSEKQSHVVQDSAETITKPKTPTHQENISEMTENNIKETDDGIPKETEKNMLNVNNIQNNIMLETTTDAPMVSKAKFSEPISSIPTIHNENLTETTISVLTTSSSIPIVVSSTTTSATTTTSIADLNLVHSELSNDIFASLQVPAECPNMESTSPTAAFLLTFPLVSSIKGTEVIDDNSDSQRETPTLLQIGNMDTSKPSQNDSLLNLDNFPFFNSKDIYYDSKIGEKKESEMSSDRSKNENYSFADNDNKIENPEKNGAEDQTLILFDQKVEKEPHINNLPTSPSKLSQDKNSLMVQSSNVRAYGIIPDVHRRECGKLGEDNGEEKRNCSKGINEASSVSTKINKSVNQNTSIKIGENCQFVQNEQNKLKSFPSDSTKNKQSIGSEQQDVNIFSVTSKLSDEADVKHKSNKGNETYNYNVNSLHKTQEIDQHLENPNTSKTYVNDFISNTQSFDCTNVPENSCHSNTNFQLDTKNSKAKIDSSKSYGYQKSFLTNSQQHLNSFHSSSNKIIEGESEKKIQEQHCLSNEFQFCSNSAKIPENSGKNLEQSNVSKACPYDPKQFEFNLNTFGTRITDASAQNFEKSDTKKTYHQNTTNYPSKNLEECDTLKSYQYNQKPFELNLNYFGPNPAKISKSPSENLVKSDNNTTYYYNSNSAKIPEKSVENSQESVTSTPYNSKQVVPDLNTFAPNPEQIAKVSRQNLEKTDINKTYCYDTTNFPSSPANMSEKSKNLVESDPSKSCRYKPKVAEINLNTFVPNLASMTEVSKHNSEKLQANKTYFYNTNFSSNSLKLSEKSSKDLEESERTKSCQYNSKRIELDLNTFGSNLTKIPEAPGQNLEKSDTNETYYYNPTNFSSNSRKTGKNVESDVAKSRQYTPKQSEINSHTLESNSIKNAEDSGQNLEKSDRSKSYCYNTTNFSSNSKKMLEKSVGNLQESVVTKSCHYTSKPIEFNLNSLTPDPTKIPEATEQNLEKSDTNKAYYYKTNNFSPISERVPEKSSENLEESAVSKSCHYNPKQFELNLNVFAPNLSKMPETSEQNLEKSDNNKLYYYNTTHFASNSAKLPEKSCQYNPKMHELNLNTFGTNPSKSGEISEGNLEKSAATKTYYYNTSNFSSNSVKMSEEPTENLEGSSKSCHYNLKQFDINVNTLAATPVKIPEVPRQNLDKNDTKKTYYYDATNFSSNSSPMLEKSAENLEESDASKTYYNQKQFENNLHTFAANHVKIPVTSRQSLEKSDTNKSYYYSESNFSTGKATKESNDSMKPYHYNPFEVVQTSREIPLNDTCNKVNTSDKGRQAKLIDSSKMPEVCSKSVEDKSCYFSSNYTSASYENKPYSNPFYSNCNYSQNYSENNFNQNYYKTDAKPSYSLNYENYQEYRRADGSFSRDKRSSAPKDKQVQQNKTVNWMTTEQKPHTSDCFLPTFTNQSYSFTSCITTDTTDIFTDGKKTLEATDKRFTWSPSKLPNFLEPAHNFITPTLPTLVGDLALGNSLPLADPKYPKDVKRKTYDNQANFLSVSQLVNQNKSEPTPARTMSRRLSGSKAKNIVSSKKRFDKTADKVSKNVNNFSDVFYDQKNRPSAKNISSNYSAEALIGNQYPQEEKKILQNNKICTNFLTENIVTYFTTAEDTYTNQNFHTYTHNSFQNNSCCSNSFIYTTPSITSSYLTNHFDSNSDYSTEGIMNYCGIKDNKNCGNKNYRMTNKDDKNINFSNVKKNKKMNQSNNTGLGNFDYPLLPIQGSTNSPMLPDDFQPHTTFLPPPTPYTCKNSLYQKQGSEFNSTPLLPLPGITRSNIQHPEVSPLNPVGTSLTNFNLSTIFPEINKGTIQNVHSSSNNKDKNSSNYLDTPFINDSKYGFTG